MIMRVQGILGRLKAIELILQKHLQSQIESKLKLKQNHIGS